MSTQRRWFSGLVLRNAREGIFEIGDGYIVELGVRWRVIGYNGDNGDNDVWECELDG